MEENLPTYNMELWRVPGSFDVVHKTKHEGGGFYQELHFPDSRERAMICKAAITRKGLAILLVEQIHILEFAQI